MEPRKQAVLFATAANALLSACALSAGLLALAPSVRDALRAILDTAAQAGSYASLGLRVAGFVILLAFAISHAQAEARARARGARLVVLACAHALLWYFAALLAGCGDTVAALHARFTDDAALQTGLACAGLGIAALRATRRGTSGMCALLAACACGAVVVSSVADVAYSLTGADAPAAWAVVTPLAASAWAALVAVAPRVACRVQSGWQCRGFFDGECARADRECGAARDCAGAARCPVCPGRTFGARLEAIADSRDGPDREAGHDGAGGRHDDGFDDAEYEEDEEDAFRSSSGHGAFAATEAGCYRRTVEAVMEARWIVQALCVLVALCVISHIAIVVWLPISTVELVQILVVSAREGGKGD